MLRMNSRRMSTRKIILASVAALVIILAVIGIILAINSSAHKKTVEKNDTSSDLIKNSSDATGMKHSENSTGNMTTSQEQDLLDQMKSKNASGCTWKTITRTIPVTVPIKTTRDAVETVTENKTYQYNISDTLRNIKKTIDGETYIAYTTYDKNNFDEFYNEFKLTGWFLDSKIAKYDSIYADSGVTIKNTDGLSGNYTVIRVYPTEKDQNYYDEKDTSDKTSISMGDSKTITFKDSILCYVTATGIDNPDSSTTLRYYKEFLKDNPGLSQDDFILFGQNDKIISCVRPYFIIIPDTYKKTYTITKKVTETKYETSDRKVEEMVCE